MWLWEWIKGIGGKRDEQAAEREELGGEDPGKSEVDHWAAGSDEFASADAADVVRADLKEFEPPRDPAP
jgi:hypothetical protein